MGWFDEQGLPGGSIAPIESGYTPQGGGWGGGRVITDDERERMRQELMTRTGGQWGGEPGGGAKIPTMDFRTGGDAWGQPAPTEEPRAYHNAFVGGPDGSYKTSGDPNGQWYSRDGTPIDRPQWPTPPGIGGGGDVLSGGSYPLPTQDFRRGGDPVPAPGPAYMPPPQGGTLGAVGMGQSEPQSFGQRIMAGTGGRNALSGAFGGLFGGAGTPTSALGFGQAPTAALQSTSGYGGGRQLGGFAGGGGSMLRSPTGVSRQVARSDVPFYLQRGATEVR